VVARFALPEDEQRFTVTVVQHPETATDVPVPWGGNRQGLYRCALRVENVRTALAAVPNSVERMGDVVWCPLPGTKIDGLYIAFLRSPDGVVFEFVERPLKLFSR
jgi:catechol 2,3-dioxygenase-like lactoylglutathione lyase family enzyme